MPKPKKTKTAKTANSPKSVKKSRTEHLKSFQWKPGTSGNPDGRPKKRLIDEMLEELLEANDSERARKVARVALAMALRKDRRMINYITERTQGKAVAKLEVAGRDGGPLTANIKVQFVSAKK